MTVLHSGVVILYATAGGCRRPHIALYLLKITLHVTGWTGNSIYTQLSHVIVFLQVLSINLIFLFAY